MAKGDYPDVFMQFRTIAHTHHANNHTTLTESYIETGLEIRGGLGWVIHQVEVEYAKAPRTTSGFAKFAISTRRNQAALPNFGERGCLTRFAKGAGFATSGLAFDDLNHKVGFRPPVILAARYMASYFQEDVDDAQLDGQTSYIRIGYTTLKLTPADYIEIAETWGE